VLGSDILALGFGPKPKPKTKPKTQVFFGLTNSEFNSIDFGVEINKNKKNFMSAKNFYEFQEFFGFKKFLFNYS
jgi:hypothetical protein